MENSQTYFPCANGSQAAIEDITGQDKSALLSILQQSTGLGKTYGTVRAIVNRAVNDQQVTFYLTPLRKDRDEVYAGCRDLLLKLGKNPEEILVNVLSEQDQVTDFFEEHVFVRQEERVIGWLDRKKLYKAWREESIPDNYPNTRHIFGLLQSILLFSDLQSEEEIEDDRKNFSQIKSMIRTDAYAIVDEEERDLSPAERKARMKATVFRDLPWYQIMFPDYDLANKKIIVMAANKFIYRYKDLAGSNKYYWRLNFNQKKPAGKEKTLVNLILDESDKIHQNWLESMLGQKQEHFDLYTLAKKINSALEPSFNKANEIILAAGDNRGRIKSASKKFHDLSNKYHLEADLVIGESLSEDELAKKFLINDGESDYLNINDQLYIEYKPDPFSLAGAKGKLFVNVLEKKKSSKQAIRLDRMLEDLNQNISSFVRNSYSMAKNVQSRIKEINRHQEANGKKKYRDEMDLEDEQRFVLRSLLGIEDKDEALVNYLLETYMRDSPQRHQTGIAANLTSDNSIFGKGFTVHILESNRNKRTNAEVSRYAQKWTPELLLATLASQWRVILVSATAETESIFSNFGLDWVYNNIPYIYHLPKKIEQLLNQENEERNKAQRDKGKINVQWIKPAPGAKLRDVFKASFPDSQLSYPEISDLISEMPSAPAGIRYDFNWQYKPESNEKITQKVTIGTACYYFGRNLKLLKALAAFCQKNRERPSRVAFIAYTNRNIREAEAKWYETALKKLGYLDQDKALVCISAKDDPEKQLERVKADWAQGKLKIILTSYSTMSRAVNLQYPAKALLAKYPEDYVVLDDRFFNKDNPFVDINGCYMEQPTHLIPKNNADRDRKQFEDEFIKGYLQLIYTCDGLINLGTPGFTYADSERLLTAYYQGYPLKREKNPFYQIQARDNAYTSQIDQTSGRMVRTVVKPESMIVILDKEIASCLNRSQIDRKRTNAVMEAIMASDPGLRLLPNQTEEKELKLKKLMASNAMGYLVQVALQLVSMPDDMQQLWIKLRTFIAKHPQLDSLVEVEDGKLAKIVPNYYWDFGHPVSGYYYYVEGDYKRLIAIGEDRDDVKRQMAEAGIKPSFQPQYLDYEEYKQALERIWKQQPWLKRELEKAGYDLSFKPSRYLLTPGAFNNLYKGAIGEAIGGAVMKHLGFDYHDMADLPNSEMERFDGYLKADDGRIVYVDWKNYNTDAPSGDNDQTVRRIKRKLGMVEMGKSAIIINISKWSNKQMQAIQIAGGLADKKVYLYPYLFDEKGELNQKLVRDFRKVF